uniref:prostate and testis expressed protein 1 isoform X1 n=1 Tax=Macaca mulatta TaxID=9544 RepID=UPI0010A286DD|nr:prostate and testis expressed protein 1 isoform X1 [Macaca mulatta]
MDPKGQIITTQYKSKSQAHFRCVFFLFASTDNEIATVEAEFPLTEIVQCRMCHLQFPGENCSRGRGICTAGTEEACMVGRISKRDGSPWLTFKDCLKNCADVKGIKWSVYFVSFSCCRSHDLCNEDL